MERSGVPYISLPAALNHYIVGDRPRIVVAGTHGKTTVSSMIAWIPVSYTHLRAHETVLDLVCRLLLGKKKFIKPVASTLLQSVEQLLSIRYPFLIELHNDTRIIVIMY